jgi:DNA polymerase III subunit beta
MHITISTSELKKVIEIVSRVSTKHITLPILQCVVLEAKSTILTIRATNLEIGIEGTIDITSNEDGVVAVPATVFLQTITLITQKEITLSTEGDILHIETQTSKTDIKTMDVSDFPTIPKVDGSKYTIQGSLFALGIKTTAFAASQSSIKPELGSIYIFQKKEHSLTFVATDSFRLIEKTIPQKGLVLDASVLIPYKNALELARVVEGYDGEVFLHIHESQCAVTVGNIYITSRLVSGTFPDYEQIIPKEYVADAVVLTQDLTQALKKTNIFLNKFMQLTFTLSDNAITLSSQSIESGATTESIHATTHGGEIRLNFNQRYIAEILGHITDESMMCKFAGIGRPMIITNVHDASLRYLVMPMNK